MPSPHRASDDDRTGSVAPLSAPEAVWTAQQRDLVAGLCSGRADVAHVSALFDRVHASWLADPAADEPHRLVDAFGVSLGDLVALRVPALTWASYRDLAGAELVLAAASHDLVVFPLATVGAHWGRVAPGWFAEHVDTVVTGARALLGDVAGGTSGDSGHS